MTSIKDRLLHRLHEHLYISLSHTSHRETEHDMRRRGVEQDAHRRSDSRDAKGETWRADQKVWKRGMKTCET